MSDLNSHKGATRQCDIVIKNGEPPRETISIVEVQDRVSKVDINTFDGWCQKMRDVGAQHLICVSKKGFPSSIIEKALRIGPTVRLLTLSELSSGNWPVNFLSNVVKNPRRELISVDSAIIDYKNEFDTEKENLTINMNEKCFNYNGLKLNGTELYFCFLDYLEGRGQSFGDGRHTINFKLPLIGDQFFIDFKGTEKEVINFSANITFDVKNREFNLSCSEYKQIQYNNELAWLMESKVFKNDEEKMFKLIIVPDSSGTYRLAARILA
nr:hypothetical protein [uncultured Desulfobacter sp.]